MFFIFFEPVCNRQATKETKGPVCQQAGTKVFYFSFVLLWFFEYF